MRKYEENILDHSVWITATPTELSKTLPFYITEAGHFAAEKEYEVRREKHDSFLMIYTVKGQGDLAAGDTQIQLRQENAVIIDCHFPHRYGTQTDNWEFLWIHFDGICAGAMFDIIYPSDTISAIPISNPYEFEFQMKELIKKADRNNITGQTDISLGLHSLLNTVCSSALKGILGLKSPGSDIERVLEFIKYHYAEPITIEDMRKDIHISRYHFIRLFRRITGVTPYQYLTNYRINISKTLLRSTDKTVAEIAENSGFLDTSNFIVQFKKHTGQKPLQYRRDFS